MRKKNTYDEVSDLVADLKKDIQHSLAGEVLDTVRKIEIRHIQDDVFRPYSPKIYQRRSTGGLDDPRNIVGEIHDLELEVKNITPFNDEYGTHNDGGGLAELVNDGDYVTGKSYDFPGEHTQPRPFLDNTADEIEQGTEVDNALGRALKKRGWDVL